MIVCIDSNIVIWGIKQQESESMIERALGFFEWCDKEKHAVMIPSIVIAEILAPETQEKIAVGFGTLGFPEE